MRDKFKNQKYKRNPRNETPRSHGNNRNYDVHHDESAKEHMAELEKIEIQDLYDLEININPKNKTRMIQHHLVTHYAISRIDMMRLPDRSMCSLPMTPICALSLGNIHKEQRTLWSCNTKNLGFKRLIEHNRNITVKGMWPKC